MQRVGKRDIAAVEMILRTVDVDIALRNIDATEQSRAFTGPPQPKVDVTRELGKSGLHGQFGRRRDANVQPQVVKRGGWVGNACRLRSKGRTDIHRGNLREAGNRHITRQSRRFKCAVEAQLLIGSDTHSTIAEANIGALCRQVKGNRLTVTDVAGEGDLTAADAASQMLNLQTVLIEHHSSIDLTQCRGEIDYGE